MTARVEEILSHYAHENEGVRQNLRRILMQGKLGGTGKLVVYPVDQGFEHGPARTFAPNPVAYDPDYFFELSIKAGVSAYAGNPGQLNAAGVGYAERMPTIMKLNSAATTNEEKNNALTGCVADAVRLKCAAIGYTVYPGSSYYYAQLEQLVGVMAEARAAGLPTVLWSYPRGGKISKDGETALDIVAYSAHMAAQTGAHIIKVKLPTDYLEDADAKKTYEKYNIARATQAERVRHVVQSCFDGKRIVLFSGGPMKDEGSVIDDAAAIQAGGGFGSIVGRNATQRPMADALELFDKLMRVYQS